MKVTGEQYIPVMLFNCVIVQDGSNFWACEWNPKVWQLMKATEQYFPVVLFIMLYMMVLTFESVDEILLCDHANESHWAVLSCGTVSKALQTGSHIAITEIPCIVMKKNRQNFSCQYYDVSMA